MNAAGERVIWHEVECGGYAADLALWADLAHEAAGPVLELGCGGGRVALYLALRGHEVTGIDPDPDLIAELRRRAASDGLAIDAVEADARSFELGRGFALVLAPMQLVHLLGGPPGRAAMLTRVARHLAPGGAAAFSLLGPDAAGAGRAGTVRPLPDVREHHGWVYSSLPLEVREAGGALVLRRLRQAVAPSGELSEQVDVVRLDPVNADELASESLVAGLRERERLEVPATVDHVGSTVLVLEGV